MLDAYELGKNIGEARFRKAKEWNKLTELELGNLRSLYSELTEDLEETLHLQPLPCPVCGAKHEQPPVPTPDVKEMTSD